MKPRPDIRDGDSGELPKVSVVIPMRNEASFIGPCLDSLLAQDYPSELLEVLVVDGCSDDGSREAVQGYAGSDRRILLIENPERITPVALNLGARKAAGDVIIILGSHSLTAPDFVRKNIEALARSAADCVGGRIETISRGLMGRTVSIAMSSPFGVGNVRFRTSNREGFVDTVAFGAYRREVFEKIGYFDEELVRNQDDEFNFRLVRSGGRIFFDPAIRSSYFSRPTLPGLWRQYFQYGRWKVRILRKHGRLPAARHLAPATALLIFTAAVAAALIDPALVWIPLLLIATYAAVTLLVSFTLAARNGPGCLLLPAAFATLHLSYATGFWCGLPSLFSRGATNHE